MTLSAEALFHELDFLESQGSSATPERAGPFCRALWTLELDDGERELGRLMHPHTLQRFLTCAMFIPQACEPGEAGRRARRETRAIWLFDAISKKTLTLGFPLNAASPWSALPVSVSPSRPRLALLLAARLARDKAPAAQAIAFSGWLACAALPAAALAAHAFGLAAFSSLAAHLALQALDRSRLSLEKMWQMKALLKTYPDLHAAGLVRPEGFEDVLSGYSRPFKAGSEAERLHEHFLGRAKSSWANDRESALREGFALSAATALAPALDLGASAPSKARL